MACVAILVGAPANAWAHHGSSTTRVDGTSTWPSASSLASAVPLPRLSTGVLYGTRYFGRVLEGGNSYEKSELGSVFLNTLSLQVAVELESRTLVGFRIPVGLVDVNSPDGENYLSKGLGDIGIHATQELVSLFRDAPTPLSVTLRGGLVMPTGHYATESRLSVTDIAGTPNGSTRIVTYNSQASLGADSWSPFAALGTRWQAWERVALFADGTVLVPLTRTRDRIRWGTDVVARAGASVEIMDDRLHWTTSLEYRHHVQDDVPIADKASGATRFESVGGRDEMAVDLGVGVRVRKNVTCSVGARVPVWQRVGGVQLVETVSGTAACNVAWGL